MPRHESVGIYTNPANLAADVDSGDSYDLFCGRVVKGLDHSNVLVTRYVDVDRLCFRLQKIRCAFNRHHERRGSVGGKDETALRAEY